MDRKEAADRLEKYSEVSFRYSQRNALVGAFETAIAALREEREPCKKCAEWEKAWEKQLYSIGCLMKDEDPSGGFYQALDWATESMRSYDPRRKLSPVPDPDPYDLWERSIKGWRM